METKTIKIVTLGESSVGKTSLIKRYVYDDFSTEEVSTIGAVFVEKTITIRNRPLKLQIWDTAGQEKFHAVAKIYYQKAHVALLLYDITSKDSFTTLKEWGAEVKANANPNILRVVVGNKMDLFYEENVSKETASKYAKDSKALFHLTSAKENKGISALFVKICEELLDREEGIKTLNVGESLSDVKSRSSADVKEGCPC